MSNTLKGSSTEASLHSVSFVLSYTTEVFPEAAKVLTGTADKPEIQASVHESRADKNFFP